MHFLQISDTVPVEFGKQFISFITGDNNKDRISLQYYHDEDSGRLYAEVEFGDLAQGPPGHAHGGAISAVFDELMGACCWVNGYPAMTAQYTTRFLKPVPLKQKILYSAKIKKIDKSKITLRAGLLNSNSEKYAEARGLFILQKMEDFTQLGTINNNSDHLIELINTNGV